jgi:predicted HAD superfamily Cof-like phosphohydrolase
MKAPSLLPAMLDLEAFHTACEVPVLDTPQIPDDDRYILRLKLLSEEFIELVEGFEKRDLDNIAQELTDLIYVAIGTALEFGIPIHHVWEAIHAANMAKVDPQTGKVRRREDGKILKPEGWQQPDIKKALYG